MKLFPRLTAGAIAVAMLASETGCAVVEVKRDQRQIEAQTRDHLADAPRSRPVFAIHDGAWLRGEQIRASKAEPDFFDKTVSYRDADGRVSSLQDVADWIASTYNVRVLIDPSVNASATTPAGRPGLPIGAQGPIPVSLSTSLSGIAGPALQTPQSPQTPLRFTGKLKDFRRVIDQRYDVYSSFTGDTLSFFKTETRLFVLPDLSDVSAGMEGTISTDSNGSSGASGSSGTSANSGSGSQSSSAGGGQSTTLKVTVDPWKSFEETAKAIAGAGANVVADKNLGVLTVTGSPPQCDRVEGFMKKLDAQFGKRIALEVRIFEVQKTLEDNYGLNLALGYKSASGHTGVTFTGASAPTVLGSATPMSFGATIVGGSLNGSKAAFQALSSLGNVSEVLSRAGVTRNGKVLSLQQATLQDYVQGSQTTLASNVGASSSIQTSTNVSGFTSSFTPKLINGYIVMDFDMTLSELQPLTAFSSGGSSNQTTVQLRTMPLLRFQQHVGLKPGETLVLTGMQQQVATSTNNGIGAPEMSLLGGGVDAQKRHSMIAVVISARLL